MRSSVLRSRLSSAAGLFGAVLLLAPPPASAHGGGHHKRHHGHHEHGDWCAPRRDYGYAPGYWVAPGYGWYAPRPVAHARYRCEPCGHWYDEEATFHRHIYRHHHIAEAMIPLVIGAAAFGWIFYGY